MLCLSLSLSRSTFDLPNAFLVLLSSFGPALNVHLIAPPPIRLTATRRLGPTVSDKLSSGCLNSRVRSTKSQSKIDANKVIRGTSPIQKEHARVTAREIIFSRLEPDGRVESNGGLLFLRSCALPLGGTWAPCPHALKLKTATQATHTLTVTCMAIGLSSAMLVSILSLTDLKSQTTQLLQAVSFNTSSHRGLVRQWPIETLQLDWCFTLETRSFALAGPNHALKNKLTSLERIKSKAATVLAFEP